MSTIEGKSAPPAMSPKPGSPEEPLTAGVRARVAALPLPAEGAPAEPPPAAGLAPPLAPPALELLPPALPDELELLDPELPLLELLDPELPVLELGELGPLAPPELGEDAPELEGADGGVGIEGVVGVLAEGQPINISMTPISPPAASGRNSGTAYLLKREYSVIRVVAPSLPWRQGSDQKTTQSYQCPRLHLPRIWGLKRVRRILRSRRFTAGSSSTWAALSVSALYRCPRYLFL